MIGHRGDPEHADWFTMIVLSLAALSTLMRLFSPSIARCCR